MGRVQGTDFPYTLSLSYNLSVLYELSPAYDDKDLEIVGVQLFQSRDLIGTVSKYCCHVLFLSRHKYLCSFMTELLEFFAPTRTIFSGHDCAITLGQRLLR